MTGAATGVVVLLAVVGPLLRYVLMRSEHDDRRRMDREQAERTARQDINTGEDSNGWRRDGRQ